MKEGAKREIDRAKIGLFVVVVALLFSTILLYTDYLRLRTERDYLMDLLDKFKRFPVVIIKLTYSKIETGLN